MWAALGESFAAEEFAPRPVAAAPCRIPGKAALGQQNGPGNLVSGREKACLADRARGVNRPLLSPRRRSAASPSSIAKLGMRGSTPRRSPQTKDARLFSPVLWRSELAEDRHHRGAARRDCLASPGGCSPREAASWLGRRQKAGPRRYRDAGGRRRIFINRFINIRTFRRRIRARVSGKRRYFSWGRFAVGAATIEPCAGSRSGRAIVPKCFT